MFRFIILISFFFGCRQRQNKAITVHPSTSVDTIVKYDTIVYTQDDNWQEGFGLTQDLDVDSIWGKPVTYYVRNPGCSPIAIDFYRGEFRPGDNNTTDALLALAANPNKQLRPFYRWCLNQTILIQDGALAEHTGVPARQYAEIFPEEFFDYMNRDTTGEKYNDWVSAITYSGFYERDANKDRKAIRTDLVQVMKRNCNRCTEQVKNRIEKFANDCFP